MDFLKSAVASAISKGPAFPYSFGDRVDIDQSIWTLHNGTRREDGSRCSIFSFDVTANKSRLPLARNALRKLRTLRHPGVIKVLDTVETDAYIYIATERLVPLGWHTRRRSLSEETLKWGLYNIAKTLKFINGEATSVHGCVRVSSIFTSESGEWKLGGFDILSSMKEDEAVIYTYGSLIPDYARYAAPEVSRSGWEAVMRGPAHAIDSFDYGILIYEVFNGSFSGNDDVGQTRNIPPTMHQSYKRLLSQNPKARISVGQFLEQGQRHGGFFQTALIQITEDIDNLGLKSEGEKEEFLSRLDEVSDDFPEDFFKMKLLPELLKSVEFGGGGPKVFQLVMRIGSKLTDEEFESKLTPVIIRLFQSPDRAMRVCLLDNLPLMIDHLPQKIVNDKIFPQMVTGFTDVAPVVREQTVKAVLTVVPKLSDRTLNGDLLRYLAKTANDEQPGIRTNTTICLGKIARNLGASTRTKVLIAAFARALRDPFVHARNAALLALAATSDLFSEEDCATKLLPGICPSLVDKEKIVRDQANKTLDVYLQRVRKYTQTMPDSVLPPPTTSASAAATPRIGTPANDTSWAGWAISSFTNKLASASGEISSSNATNSEHHRPASTPAAPITPSARPPAPRSTTEWPSITSAAKPPKPTPPEAEDFGSAADAWGDIDEPAAPNDDEDDAFDSWDTPAATAPKSSSSATFDDQGEPDFAGWLAAQSQAKKGAVAKKPLPKGLTKAGAATTKSSSRTVVPVAAAKKAPTVPVAKPKVEVKPKPEEEEVDDEAWGDAWD